MKWLTVVLDMLLALVTCLYFALERLVFMLVPTRWIAKDIGQDVALVTGAGSGLGRLTALGLSKLCDRVVLLDIDQEANRETARQVSASGGRAFAYRCDVSDREDVYRVCALVKHEVGDVTILVNNAGVVNGRELLDTPDASIERLFRINAMAHFWTVKAFLPNMIEKNHGHIVTIASLAGYVGCNKLVDYSSSKFAAVGFDEALKAEIYDKGCDGIHTSCICPFYINTGMFDGVKSSVLPILEPEYVAQCIINAILTNEDVVILPRSCLILLILKMIMPSKAMRPIDQAFQTSKTMASFTGRPPPKASKLPNDSTTQLKMFPSKCMAVAGKTVGFFEMMSQFRGRQDSDKKDKGLLKQ